MSAQNKQNFVKFLPDFLNRANLPGTSKAYYSFFPVSGQNNFEFLFNDLYSTGNMFLGYVSSVEISEPGSGYGAGETPIVSFISQDAGTGVAATALMGDIGGGPSSLDAVDLVGSYSFNASLPFSGTSTSMIPSGNFSSGSLSHAMGWLNLDGSPFDTGNYKYFRVVNNELRVEYNSGGLTQSTVKVLQHPNSGLTKDSSDYSHRWFFVSAEITRPHPTIEPTYHRKPTANLIIYPPKSFVGNCTHNWGDGTYEASGSISSGTVYTGASGFVVVSGSRAIMYSGILGGANGMAYVSYRDIFGPWVTTGIGTSSFTTTYTGHRTIASFDVYKSGVQKFGVYGGFGSGQPRVRPNYYTWLIVSESQKIANSGVSGDYFTMNNFSGWSDYYLNNNNYSGRADWNDLNRGSGSLVLGNLNFTPSDKNDYFKLADGVTGGMALWSLILGDTTLATASTAFVNADGTGPDFSNNTSLAFWFKVQTLGITLEKFLEFQDSTLSLGANYLTLENIHTRFDGRTPISVTTTISTDPFINTGQWYYITARRSEPNAKLYLSYSGYNNNSITEYSMDMPTNAQLMGKTGLTIFQTVNSVYYIDDLRIWNKYIDPKKVNSFGVTGIILNALGDNYNLPPLITIGSPTGSNGITATAYSIITPNTGKIYAENFPAISVGGSNYIVTGITNTSGSGTFLPNNNDFLRVGNTIPFNDWTAFINFAPTGDRTGVCEVLLSTMDSVNQKSGLMIGISDSDRLFVEYIDTTHPLGGQRRTRIHNQELGTNNLISVSTDSVHGSVTLCNHNIAKQDSYTSSYLIPGYVPNQVMYIGGFPNSTNDTRYTGFIGKMYDFLLLSGAANSVQMEAVSPIFFVNSYKPVTQSPVNNYFSIVTGAQLVSVVLETGITGYSLNSVAIPDKDGSNLQVYSLLPQVGEISGTGVSYSFGEESGVYITYSGFPEVLSYNNAYIRTYADSNFVMLNYSVSSGDILEVYSYTNKWMDKISIIPESFNLYDFYLSNDYTTGQVNMYSDGLLQVTGIDYVLTSGKIVSNLYAGYHSTYNLLLYDEIPGTTITSGWTGWVGGRTIGGNPTQYGRLDVYLNGQKLISGIDYIFTGSQDLVLTGTQFGNQVSWASGIFAFAPARTDNRRTTYLSGVGYWNDFSASLGNLMDEMIFLNGQRLAPGIDYKTVSSFSMLNSDYRPNSQTFVLYTGDLLALNILTTKPNISTTFVPGDAQVPLTPPTPLY